MPETQHNDTLDEHDLEISDLSDEHEGSGRNARRQALRWISRSPFLWRKQRRLSVFLTSCVVVAALLVLLASVVPVRSLFIPAPFSISSAPPTRMLSGDNLFYFQALPSWGTLTIDERPLPSVPMLSTDRPIRIAYGTHRLQWQAHPFEPLRCTLAVPPDPTRQTCFTTPFGGSQYARTATVISFPRALSLASLLDASRSEYAFSMMSPDREQEMEHTSRGDWQQATLHMDDHLMPGQTSSFDYTFDDGASPGIRLLHAGAEYSASEDAVHAPVPGIVTPCHQRQDRYGRYETRAQSNSSRSLPATRWAKRDWGTDVFHIFLGSFVREQLL